MSKDFWYPENERKTQRQKIRKDPRKLKKLRNSAREAQASQEAPLVKPPTPPTIQENPIEPPIQEPTRTQAQVQTQPKTQQEILNELYTNPNFPTAYSGDLRKFLLEKESLSRHRKKRHIFKRRKVFVGGPYTAIQADTIFYRDYGRENAGYKYILGMGLKNNIIPVY